MFALPWSQKNVNHYTYYDFVIEFTMFVKKLIFDE